MRKPAKTPQLPPSRGAASSRIVMSLALAVSAGAVWWSTGGAKDFSFARDGAPTLETRVAALTSELSELKAETAKLRERQDDTSGELLQLRASLSGAETGLATLRTAADESEARRRDTADKIESNIAMLKRLTIRLREAQEDTAGQLGGLQATAANNQIGIDELRASTGDMRQQIARIEIARDATSSIGRPHRTHRVRRAVRAPETGPQLSQPFLAQWPGLVPTGRN